MAEFKLPTEVIDLPSKGLLYPKDNPLSEGKIELKYMTAKEETHTVDLSKIEFVDIDTKLWENGNNFSFTLPASKNTVTFKILTHGDELKIANETKSMKKVNKEADATVSTRLKYMITSIEGDSDIKKIREYVDRYMLARDSRALRAYAKSVTPDVDLSFFPDGQDDKASIPVGLSFFWPDVV